MTAAVPVGMAPPDFDSIYDGLIAERIQLLTEPRYKPVVGAIAEILTQTLLAGRRIYWMGNGGSAADAQHLAAEFTGRFLRERRGLSSEALTTNTSSLTAIANDYGYDAVFSRQIEAMVVTGDAVVGLTTSGNSANVVAGLEEAKRRRAITIAFTGNGGGNVAAIADVVLIGPTGASALVQEVHIALGHIVCDLVERGVIEADAKARAEPFAPTKR